MVEVLHVSLADSPHGHGQALGGVGLTQPLANVRFWPEADNDGMAY